MKITDKKREGLKENIKQRFPAREITLSLGHSKILRELAVECMHQLQDETGITQLLTKERKLPDGPALIQSIAHRLGLPGDATRDAITDYLVCKSMENFYVKLGRNPAEDDGVFLPF